MKRAASPKLRVIAVLTSILTILSSQPSYAAQFITNMNSGCSRYGMDPVWQIYKAFTIPAATTITSATWKMWDTNPPTAALIRFYSDNASSPSTNLLGSLTYASWSSPIGTFTGSVNLPTAGTYWIRFSTTSRIDPCYVFNSVTTGTPSGWSFPTIFTRESSNSGSTFGSRGDYLTFLFTLFGTGGGAVPESSSISLSSSSVGSIRQNITISASLGVSGTDGRVTFFANGKRIPNCSNLATTSLTASCTWKPSIRGAIAITARLTPTDSGFAPSTSTVRTILVGNRTTLR